MKSGTRDDAEGKLHQVKGRIKQAVAHLNGNKGLKQEGKRDERKAKSKAR